MATAYLEFTLVVVYHDRVDDPHGVLFSQNALQHYVGDSSGWSLNIDQNLQFLVDLKSIRVRHLAQLTGELLPVLRNGLIRILLYHFGLHPIFEAFVMDESDPSSAFARRDQWVFLRFLVGPAEFANALITLFQTLFELLYVRIFTVLVIFEDFFPVSELLHPKSDASKFDDVVSLDFVVNVLGILEGSDDEPHLVIHLCGGFAGRECVTIWRVN